MSFLEIVRCSVKDSIGSCRFTEEPVRHHLADKTPTINPDWILGVIGQCPPKPDPTECTYLLNWYFRASNSVLNLFDEHQLRQDLCQWQSSPLQPLPGPTDAILFLVLAIGSKVCPEDRDDFGERYFNYGRYLITSHAMESPDISTVRANTLIALYLLNGSRRNAAFMYLGTAVRAAYALGIHRNDMNALFDKSEYAARERLWKVLRILDLFMSASLGREPATTETRDTSVEDNYSAATDLCAIFEVILTQVYSKRTVCSKVLEQTSQHHRKWASRFHTGLAVDNIPAGELIDTVDGRLVPNVALCHLKEAYYWTIILLARPFLIRSVTSHISQVDSGASIESNTSTEQQEERLLTHACVYSAIRTVDLFRPVSPSKDVPKRLPFAVNSVFIAGLVLGLAHFGDMDHLFPLEKGLEGSISLLSAFSRYDAEAMAARHILQNLQAACCLYVEKRESRKMERQSLLVGNLFGTVFKDSTLHTAAATQEPRQGTRSGEENCFVVPSGDDQIDSLLDSTVNDHCSLTLGMDPDIPHDVINMDDVMLPFSPGTLMFETLDCDVTAS
ncbi:hypothetical protein ACHAPT_010503 [Fusarium lateritium]